MKILLGLFVLLAASVAPGMVSAGTGTTFLNLRAFTFEGIYSCRGITHTVLSTFVIGRSTSDGREITRMISIDRDKTNLSVFEYSGTFDKQTNKFLLDVYKKINVPKNFEPAREISGSFISSFQGVGYQNPDRVCVPIVAPRARPAP